MQRKRPWLPLQLHVRQLVQQLIAFAPVAVMAASHQVLPGRQPAPSIAATHDPASSRSCSGSPHSIGRCYGRVTGCSSATALASGAESGDTPAVESPTAKPSSPAPRAASIPVSSSVRAIPFSTSTSARLAPHILIGSYEAFNTSTGVCNGVAPRCRSRPASSRVPPACRA